MNSKFYLLGLSAFFILGLTDCAKTSNSGTSSTTTTTTTCQSGYLYSTTYGCQLQCGTSSIWYNNQCISTTSTVTTTGTVITGTTTTTGTVVTGGTTTTVSNICSQACPTGMVAVGYSCLPQVTCGACYGYAGGYCYEGNGAPAYYGY